MWHLSLLNLKFLGCCSWLTAQDQSAGPKPYGKKLLCPDFSGGLEPIEVPCTNDVDDEPPPYLEYITKSRLISLNCTDLVSWSSLISELRSDGSNESLCSDMRESHWAARSTATHSSSDQLKLAMGVLFAIPMIPLLLYPFTYHLQSVKTIFAKTG